jgi:hypothetical protein
MKRHYHSTRFAFKGKNNFPPPRPAANITFIDLLQSSRASTEDAETQVTQAYRKAFVHDEAGNEKARRIALHVYTNAYTTTRAAFVRATYMANKMQDATVRLEVFKSLMSSRLNQDLMYDTMRPSFFLQIMNSRTIKVIAGVLLLAGVIAIVCATYGIAGLPFTPTIAAGGTSSAIGAGLFIGSFFAYRQCQHIDEENQQAEAMLVNNVH